MSRRVEMLAFSSYIDSRTEDWLAKLMTLMDASVETARPARSFWVERRFMLVTSFFLAVLLGLGLYLFFGALYTFGIEGTAAIYDMYTKGLPFCL